MKIYLKTIFSIIFIFITNCIIDNKIMCVVLPSTPFNVYNKEKKSISVEYSLLPLFEPITNRFWCSAGFQKYINLLRSHFGISIYYYYEHIYYYSITSGGIFLYNKYWLKYSKRKYPFANIYLGIQPSFISYNYHKNKEIDRYFPITFDFGFCPGIYRDKYNINFALRGGKGILAYEKGKYFEFGCGIGINVLIKKNILLGGNLDIIGGTGSKPGAALEAYAPFMKFFIIINF